MTVRKIAGTPASRLTSSKRSTKKTATKGKTEAPTKYGSLTIREREKLRAAYSRDGAIDVWVSKARKWKRELYPSFQQDECYRPATIEPIAIPKGFKLPKYKGRPVIVTTEYRGIFFGYIEDESKFPSVITLEGMRCCISWGGMKSFLALASDGPNSICKISPPIVRGTLSKCTGIWEVSSKAVPAWEVAPWSL